MLRLSFICLWLGLSAWGQVSGAAPASPAQQQDNKKADATPALGEFPADKVPQDAIIVTITGLCDHPLPAKADPSECKTTFTRAEFEKVVDLLSPHAPQAGRRMLANSYAQTLVRAQRALDMGLDKRPDFADRMEVNRLLISHETLDEVQAKEEWDKVTDKQIEDYYRQNPAEFVQVDAERLFVPWFEPDENKQLPEAEKLKADLEWQRKLREEADKLHTRAVAGEDLLALQKEAYQFTGVSPDIERVNITLPKTRRLMLTPALMPLMDLQPGQISAVLVEDNGYYIFKATKRANMPFDYHVTREVHNKFQTEGLKKDKEELQKLVDASTTYNDNYFGPPTVKRDVQESPGYDVMPVQK
jgi:hypothetical protein